MAINVKREGTSHEARFKSEALKRGLDVLVPEGDYLPYDCMVVNGEGTKIRVQVTGTSYRAKGSKAHRLLAGAARRKPPLIPIWSTYWLHTSYPPTYSTTSPYGAWRARDRST